MKKLTAKEIRDKLEDNTLDLSLCDLDEVPVQQISTIRRFSHLDLSNNALVTLPKTFPTLTQIVKLDLSKNMLSELPDNFGELRQLRHLDLYSNRLSWLPLSLSELKTLKWLDLKENPLSPALAQVAGACSNGAECQACAKNVVAYMGSVKLEMEEERIRQREQEIREEAERSLAASKKEAKKKRKAAEKKAAAAEKERIAKALIEEIFEQNNKAQTEISEADKSLSGKEKNSRGAMGVLCGAFTHLVLWSIFFALLAVLVVVAFPIYDQQRSDQIFKYVESQTGLPVKSYRRDGMKLVDVVIEHTKLWTNHIREYVEREYRRYFLTDESVQVGKKSGGGKM